MDPVKITIGGYEVTVKAVKDPRGPTDTDMLREALGMEPTGEGLHNDELPGR